MRDLAEVFAAAIDAGGRAIFEALFADAEIASVAGEVANTVRRVCGSPVVRGLWCRTSVGIVSGVVLADGRQVVVKVHRWNVDLERLRGVLRVQAACADAGLPAPRPLGPPAACGRGLATVEELVPADVPRAPRAEVCHELARVLVELVRIAPVDERVGAPPLLVAAATGRWPEPHDVRFDFDASGDGAEAIDAAWREAAGRLRRQPPRVPVVAHFDWRVENLGFDGARLVAIYDWDALAVAPEAVAVGVNAAHWCSDWRSAVGDTLPSVDDMRWFVDAYERRRGAAFTREERDAVDAANLAVVAYGARCQHADDVLRPELGLGGDDPWSRLLRERGTRVW